MAALHGPRRLVAARIRVRDAGRKRGNARRGHPDVQFYLARDRVHEELYELPVVAGMEQVLAAVRCRGHAVFGQRVRQRFGLSQGNDGQAAADVLMGHADVLLQLPTDREPVLVQGKEGVRK